MRTKRYSTRIHTTMMCTVFGIEYEPYIRLPLFVALFYSLFLLLFFRKCRFIPYRITIIKHLSELTQTQTHTNTQNMREGKSIYTHINTCSLLLLPRNTRPSYGFQLFSNMSHFNLNQSFYGMTEWHLSMSPCFEFNFLCILNVIRSKCKFSPAFSIYNILLYVFVCVCTRRHPFTTV